MIAFLFYLCRESAMSVDKDDELALRALELLAVLVPHLEHDCIFDTQLLDTVLTVSYFRTLFNFHRD